MPLGITLELHGSTFPPCSLGNAALVSCQGPPHRKRDGPSGPSRFRISQRAGGVSPMSASQNENVLLIKALMGLTPPARLGVFSFRLPVGLPRIDLSQGDVNVS
jgi:hypothetical protein